MGTIVNRAFQSLHGESLEMKLSVPLKKTCFEFNILELNVYKEKMMDEA